MIKVILAILNYLGEIVIYFSLSWLIVFAIAFGKVFPEEGAFFLLFATTMATIPRISRWIKERNE